MGGGPGTFLYTVHHLFQNICTHPCKTFICFFFGRPKKKQLFVHTHAKRPFWFFLGVDQKSAIICTHPCKTSIFFGPKKKQFICTHPCKKFIFAFFFGRPKKQSFVNPQKIFVHCTL